MQLDGTPVGYKIQQNILKNILKKWSDEWLTCHLNLCLDCVLIMHF